MGALLYQAGRRAGTSAGDTRIDFQKQVEDKYREQLAQLLTPLVGAGNFTAEVQADVNLDESQATRESYDKDGALSAPSRAIGPAPARTASIAAPGGIPGALSNTPPPAEHAERPASAAAAGRAPRQSVACRRPGAAAPAPALPTRRRSRPTISPAPMTSARKSRSRAPRPARSSGSRSRCCCASEPGKPRAPGRDRPDHRSRPRRGRRRSQSRRRQVTVISRKFTPAAGDRRVGAGLVRQPAGSDGRRAT